MNKPKMYYRFLGKLNYWIMVVENSNRSQPWLRGLVGLQNTDPCPVFVAGWYLKRCRCFCLLRQSTCKVLASVLIFSEMSAAWSSPPLPLALPLSRLPGLRWASRPRGLCTPVLSYESDSLDVFIVWDDEKRLTGQNWRLVTSTSVACGKRSLTVHCNLNQINAQTGLVLTFLPK